jgi:hypothetical protein
VRAAVSAFEGDIRVVSEPGRGTTWSFAFADSIVAEDLERLGASLHSGATARGFKRPSLPSMSA